MSWTPLVAAIVGAVIAMGSTLLAERRRTQREDAAEWRRTRQSLYSKFLAAHAQAGSDLRNIASTPDLELGERYRQARAAYTLCYVSRHELEILAPDSVVRPAYECSRSVRAMRDAVSTGATLDTPDFTELTNQYLHFRLQTTVAMRSDLVSGRR
ncbi:hypothetical protein [Streptomyces sp. NBC_00019]|uniref:hypothetical protein n=1 Tax=Streptomyces sp. NBC_00019 TaxID=2975623 RepID=UPI00324E87B0